MNILRSLVLLFLFSTSIAQTRTDIFTDVAAEAGIDFRYTFGDYTYENILESSGSGITILDYNGDGYMDIYMLNGTYLEGISDPDGREFKNTPNKLYRNNGDGTFTETGKNAGVDDRHWSMAAGAIDYDNDGDTDIYLLNYGPNVFYRNNGDGTFTDIAGKLGLRGPEKLNGFTKWSVSVAFWDYNQDSRLDMMVGNFLAFDPAYVSPTTPGMMPHPSEYTGQPSFLYEQQPDGTYRDVTKKMGIYYPESMCMGLTVFDYEQDGDPDLFQGNDHQKNFLFRNNGDLTFSEVAVQAGVAVNNNGKPTGSMHGSIADVDGDGLIDLLVTDLRYGAMYRYIGDGLFEDITEESGIARHFSGKGQWGAVFFDYDNDGDPDIFSANGTAEELILQPPLLLENDGQGNFSNAGPRLGEYFRGKRSGRAAASVDYDNDGDLDIVVSHVDLEGDVVFLKNETDNSNHWLGLTLKGRNGVGPEIGAQVKIISEMGEQVLVNQWATTYLSFNDPRLHVGLGKADKIQRLEVKWMDGTLENYDNIIPDRYITIIQGKGIINE